MKRLDLRLYVLVDGDAIDGDLAQAARQAVEGGATLVQYRDKQAPTRLMVERASAIGAALAGSGVPLLVNDRVDVALAAGTAGVHLGREDMAPDDARRLLGRDAIVGVTVKGEVDFAAALSPCADYACIGGVFATTSKHNPEPPVGLEGLARFAGALRGLRPGLPLGAIAGIDKANAASVIAAGADGVAVISAVFASADPAVAARHLRGLVDQALAGRAA